MPYRTVDTALFKETFREWSSDKAPRLAAAISFAAAFAVAPLLIIVIAIVGAIVGATNGGHGHHLVEDQLLARIRASAGPGAADAVREMVTVAFSKPRANVIAQIVGWIAFVFGAIGLFAALQDALNTIWHVEPAKSSWLMTLRERIASIAIILVIGLLLLGSTILGTVITLASTYAGRLGLPGTSIFFAILNWIVSIAIASLLFAAIYKVLPDAVVAWRDVWFGAIATAILFVIGETLISFYFARFGVASAYGAAGSILVFLLWVYYSAMLLLFGAELTKVYAKRSGLEIRAREAAGGPADVSR
jgi:membrane protein